MATSNNHIAIIAQIESVRGVENVDAIAAHPNVSALMVGAGDFSADAQVPVAMTGAPHPVLAAAMAKVSEAARRNGKPMFG